MAVVVQTSVAVSGSGASISVDPPAGLASGDMWLICFVQDDNNAVFDAPAGFSTVDTSFNTTWPRLGEVYKPNCSGSETAVTVTITGGSGNIRAHSIRISGQDTSDPLR